MVGTKEICALLLAGSMGAGSVVAVQQAKPAISKPKASKPKAHKTASRNVTRAQISDCPTLAAPLGGGIAQLAPIPSFETMAPDGVQPLPPAQVALVPGAGVDIPSIIGGGGGGGSGPAIVDPTGPTGGVPQPASWAMMVTGFGLVGLALRKPDGGAVVADGGERTA